MIKQYNVGLWLSNVLTNLVLHLFKRVLEIEFICT
jgi:hypothetical protein